MSLRAALGIALPLALAAAACILALRFVSPGVDLDAMARGVIGPATWPKAMLLCAAAAAAALALLRLLEALALRAPPRAAAGDEYHETRSLAAVALLVGYVVAIAYAGFAWATPVFIAGWLLLGGVRRPLLVALTSVLGTVCVLYFFVKVSAMPLERGRGVFEEATLTLYQVLGIY